MSISRLCESARIVAEWSDQDGHCYEVTVAGWPPVVCLVRDGVGPYGTALAFYAADACKVIGAVAAAAIAVDAFDLGADQ
jgi:hypothetical protein